MNRVANKYQDEMEIERMWLATKQGEFVFFSILPISTILVFVLWDQTSHQLLLSWFFILTGINFFRWIYLRFYHLHKEELIADARRFKWYLFLGCLISGCWVGMGNVLFLEPSQMSSVLVMSIFTICVGLGAILSWFFYLPAVIGILLPITGTIEAILLRYDNNTTVSLGIMFILLSILGTIASIKLDKMLNHALKLNFENVELRRESEQKSLLLETTLENMAQGISMADSNDQLRMWNRQFTDLLGTASIKVNDGAGLSELLNAADPPLLIGNKGTTEYRLANGQVYQIRQAPIAQGGRVLTYTDISELIRREQALETARKEAEQANIAKTRFLASASHDLRQPIHALGLFFAELSGRVYSPETALLIGQVEDSIAAINSMLNSLLDVSKLDAGVVKTTVEAVALTDLFQRLQIDFQSISLENNNQLHIHSTTKTVYTDPALLERMLRNLIGNALRYTENGRVVVAARPSGQLIEIQVLDTGTGIPEDQLEDIFIEFHQLHNPARDRRQGLGLGLAIVKRLAKLLQHKINVSSKLGYGSCFSISLPRASVTNALEVQARQEKSHHRQNALTGIRIMVLDDDISILEGMQGLLLHWGCHVLAATSLEAVLTLLAENEQDLDLLIIDYRLQNNASGISIAKNLQSQLAYPVAVLIITGDTDPERLREADASGYQLLHKPVQPAKLRSTIQYLLTKRATR